MLGDSWVDLGVLDPALWGVFCFTHLGDGIVLAGTGGPGADGGHWYKSLDYGITWVDKGKTPGGQAYINALINTGSGIIVAAMAGNKSEVERSPNWGESFVFIKELDNKQKGCNTGTYCGNNIVLVGTDGSGWIGETAMVFKSADKGLTWDAGKNVSSVGLDVTSALLYLGNNIVIAGTIEGEIARSVDNGDNWAIKVDDLVDSGDKVEGFVHLGSGVVLLCSFLGHIYRSSDYGANWSKIASPSSGTALSQFVRVGSMIFVCGAGGHVYRSLNGGYNWTDLGVILPGHVDLVYCLGYFQSETEQILIAGYYKPGIAGEARIARAAEAIAVVRPTDLLCEQTKNPVNVSDPQPEFSAIYHA